VHPEYPFFYLVFDHLWETDDVSRLTMRRSGSNPLKSEFIKFGTRGGFPAPIFEAFRRDPLLVHQTVDLLLNAHFPPSIYEEILAAVGLDLETEAKRTRLSGFRAEVLES